MLNKGFYLKSHWWGLASDRTTAFNNMGGAVLILNYTRYKTQEPLQVELYWMRCAIINIRGRKGRLWVEGGDND